MTLGALLALLVGFDVDSVGAMVFCDFKGRSEGGDLGMWFFGLEVGVGQTGTAVGQPCTIDGAADGTLEGPTRGARVGATSTDGEGVGRKVAEGVGFAVGPKVGEGVGSAVSFTCGWKVGEGVGSTVGIAVGPKVGEGVGSDVGMAVGWKLGESVGSAVGMAVGWKVGEGVGPVVGFFEDSTGCDALGKGGEDTSLGDIVGDLVSSV